MQVFIQSAEHNWNFGGSTDEVWNGWHHVESTDNFWGCGNNIGLTLQKGNIYDLKSIVIECVFL